MKIQSAGEPMLANEQFIDESSNRRIPWSPKRGSIQIPGMVPAWPLGQPDRHPRIHQFAFYILCNCYLGSTVNEQTLDARGSRSEECATGEEELLRSLFDPSSISTNIGTFSHSQGSGFPIS